MEKSKALFARSQKVAPGGVHSPVRAFKSVGGEPIFFKKAEGAYLETVDGQRLIDFCQSFGPHLLGHRDPDVAKVVHETVDMAWSFGTCEPYSLDLAEWMVKRLPWIEKVRFTTSGTEAVMSALRLARAATNRPKILKFTGCYHGHADALLVKAGSGLAGAAAADSAGLNPLLLEQTLVVDLDNERAFREVMEKNGDEIAAVIIEPLPANYGLLIQRREFLHEVAKVTQSAGALLIFDEVISGFRVACGGMAEVTGIRPDLVTYGKVIGGGFPVGAYAGPAKLMDLVAPMGPVYQAGTLSANPVGMRAGLATLQKAERLNLWQELEQRTIKWARQLSEDCAKKDWPLAVSAMGSIFWWHGQTSRPIRSLSDLPQDQSETFKKLFHACLKQGVYLAPSGFEVGFISNAHTIEILEQARQKILSALEEVYG
ncbi:MAG: glutamate-1-semialdehyde 2,1-aminomutase [Bdellovibrionales bacterium]